MLSFITAYLAIGLIMVLWANYDREPLWASLLANAIVALSWPAVVALFLITRLAR